MLNPYLMYIKLGIVAAIVVAVYFFGHHQGYQPEHDKFTTFKASVAEAGSLAAAQAKQLDAQHEKELQDAQTNTLNTATAITDYYKSHPVIRVYHDRSGGCSLSKTDSNSSKSDEASTAGYVSPYSPESTEQVANQLDQLQKLLIKDGVTVQ